MKKLLPLLALLLALSLLLSGCAGNPLLGRWRRSNGERFEFRGNGICIYTSPEGEENQWIYSLQGDGISFNLNEPDRYTVEGDTFTLYQGQYRFVFTRE